MNTFKTIVLRWISILLLAALAHGAYGLQLDAPLVETGWLADHLDQVVVLDIRKDGSSYAGKPAAGKGKPNLKQLTGHIPGAVAVPFKKVSVKRKAGGMTLKGMRPEANAFAALMRACGVDDDSAVVIAGRGASTLDVAFATRLYWTLEYFGHDNVALLNGGTAKWAKEGRTLAYGRPAVEPGGFTVRAQRERLLADTAEMERALTDARTQIVDCRSEDFFLGLTYKRGFVPARHKGHLPGAKNLPHVLLADNYGPAVFYPLEQIREVAALNGVDLSAPTIAYCNTGMAASLTWFVLHELEGNRDVKLYDGSMHEWTTVNPELQLVSLVAPMDEVTPATGSTPDTEPVDTAWATTVPPRSLATLPGQRREALQCRREERRERLSGRRFYPTYRTAAYADALDAYRDRVKDLHRERRDHTRTLRHIHRSIFSPWSESLRNHSERRRQTLMLAHLERQDAMEYWRTGRLHGPVDDRW